LSYPLDKWGGPFWPWVTDLWHSSSNLLLSFNLLPALHPHSPMRPHTSYVVPMCFSTQAFVIRATNLWFFFLFFPVTSRPSRYKCPTFYQRDSKNQCLLCIIFRTPHLSNIGRKLLSVVIAQLTSMQSSLLWHPRSLATAVGVTCLTVKNHRSWQPFSWLSDQEALDRANFFWPIFSL
jgi:hypothetical protein